jgi:alkylated DNA nucleotide flippase Atl1
MFKAMYAVVKNIPRGKVASYGTVAIFRVIEWFSRTGA